MINIFNIFGIFAAGWSNASTSKNWLKHKTLNNDAAGANVTGTPLEADSKFLLWQFNLHWGKDDTQGSEHTVNGREFPMEVHFVHGNPDRQYCWSNTIFAWFICKVVILYTIYNRECIYSI